VSSEALAKEDMLPAFAAEAASADEAKALGLHLQDDWYRSVEMHREGSL